MTVQINRKDRGLDFKRIEKIVEIFEEELSKNLRNLQKEKDESFEHLKEKSFEEFGINSDFQEIENINAQIKKLKVKIEKLEEQKEPYKKRIRDFTQGEKDRWGSYYDIRKGSPIHDYITKNMTAENKSEALNQLKQDKQQEIWFARDIEHATDIYNGFVQQMNKILSGETLD